MNKQTIPYTKDRLTQLVQKFPELNEQVNSYVKGLVSTGVWDTIVSDIAYKPKSALPRTLTVKHLCKRGAKTTRHIQSFVCLWKSE